MSAPKVKKLGIVAGGGYLPERLIHSCEKNNIEVFIVGFEKQTPSEVYKDRPHMITRIGSAGKILNTLRSHEIRDLVLIGSIRRPTLTELKPDIKTAKFFAKIGLKALGDDGLLKALRNELEDEGFKIHGAQDFAEDLLTESGPVGRFKPKKEDLTDIRKGIEIARTLGKADIGQAVIIQEGLVLGVEAAEGTDELIRRCKNYKRKGRGGVLVKLSKPQQDLSLDLPTIGPETVKLCIESGLSGIAVEAKRSLMVDPTKVAEYADKAKIFVTGINPDDI